MEADIDGFSYVEPSLLLCDEAHLIMLDDVLDVSSDLAFEYFIEYFWINAHDGNWFPSFSSNWILLPLKFLFDSEVSFSVLFQFGFDYWFYFFVKFYLIVSKYFQSCISWSLLRHLLAPSLRYMKIFIASAFQSLSSVSAKLLSSEPIAIQWLATGGGILSYLLSFVLLQLEPSKHL